MSLESINGDVRVNKFNSVSGSTPVQTTKDNNVQMTTGSNNVDPTKITHSNDSELTPEQKAEKEKLNQKQLDEIAEMKAQANQAQIIRDFDKLAKDYNGEIQTEKNDYYESHILYDENGKIVKKLAIFYDQDNKGVVSAVFEDTPEYDENGELTKITTVNAADGKPTMEREYKDGKLVCKRDLTGELELPTERYFYDGDGNLSKIEYGDTPDDKRVEYYAPGNSEAPYLSEETRKTGDGTEVYEETHYDDEGNMISSVQKENGQITKTKKRNDDGTVKTTEFSTCSSSEIWPFIVQGSEQPTKVETSRIEDENGVLLSNTTIYTVPETGDQYEIRTGPDGTVYLKNGEVL